MNLLFIVKRSPFISRDFDHILEVAREGSQVILVQDAVLAAVDTPENRAWVERLTGAGVGVNALREDLAARGVSRLLPEVEVVDYGGWVRLIEACERIVSWT